MKLRNILLSVCGLALMAGTLKGEERRFCIGTNIFDYLNLCTLNLEGGMSISRHLSIHLSGKYNPFSWSGPSGTFQERQLSASVDARFWPWYIYSGWYYGGGLRFRQYNIGGITSKNCEEGNAFGAALKGGYALMINRWMNIEFGLGAWCGVTSYRSFEKPLCGKLTGSGTKFFILPDSISISVIFTL